MLPFRVPTLFLNNGMLIPVLGLGTWKTKGKEIMAAVSTAIDLGYRHIDCALFYGNEHEIGVAIREKIHDKVINREDIFITSKLWNTFHRPDLVEPAILKTLCDLKTDYLDLYLMHWPMGYKEGRDLLPMEKLQIMYSNVHYIDTWKAMEKLVDKKLTKSIGISNFNKVQIEDVLKIACIKPAIIQVECHPYLNQKSLIQFCKSRDIAFTCYSPLGGSPQQNPSPKKDKPSLLNDPRILEIAEAFCKSPAQVLLRYQIQRGNIVIPKSVTPARIKENMEIFDFSLKFIHMQEIDGLNKEIRYVTAKGASNHLFYPFKKKCG